MMKHYKKMSVMKLSKFLTMMKHYKKTPGMKHFSRKVAALKIY